MGNSKYPIYGNDLLLSEEMNEKKDGVYLSAVEAIGNNNYEEAITYLSKAINVNSESAENYYVRAICNIQINNTMSAIPDFYRYIIHLEKLVEKFKGSTIPTLLSCKDFKMLFFCKGTAFISRPFALS